MTANWNNQEIQRLLATVIEVKVVDGVATDNGFKKQHWTKIHANYNRGWQGTNMSKIQLQNKLTQLKKKYAIFANIVNNSGFGFHAVTKLPTAPDDVWDAYIAAHPDALQFRHATLPFYDELHQIFSTSIAIGSYAVAANGSGILSMASPTSQESPRGNFSSDSPGEVNSSHIGENLAITQILSPMSPQASSQSHVTSACTPSTVTLAPSTDTRPTKRIRISKAARAADEIAGAMKAIADTVVKKANSESELKKGQLFDTLRAISTINKEFADIFSKEVRARMIYIISHNPSYVEIFHGFEESVEKTEFLEMLLLMHPNTHQEKDIAIST